MNYNLVNVLYQNSELGLYDLEKKIFFPNKEYFDILNNTLEKIRPDMFIHICIKYKIRLQDIFESASAIAYDCIETDIASNTILFIGDNQILSINEKGDIIRNFYSWKLVKH